MGAVVVAYQEGDHIVAVPLDNRFFEPNGVFYRARLNGSLRQHVISTFAAGEIRRTREQVGVREKAVWRPGFVNEGDLFAKHVVRQDKQSLFLLIAKLNDIFLTIDPTPLGLKSHGPKIRELHLLACMEVESYFRQYLDKGLGVKAPKRPRTNDYFPLKKRLCLGEYGVDFVQ